MALTKVTEDMRTLGTGEVLDANIATDTISIGKISGSAAGAAGTFLKQDGTWATAGTVTDTTTIEDDIALLGFKVAVNGSLAKYNLVDQTEDAFMDATGIDASASTNETRNAANYYSGSAGTTQPTGGTITTHGIYKVHSFLANGTFTTYSSANVDYLVVAGGGSGGWDQGGGGGAGGMLSGTGFATTAQAYSITVGSGGTGTGARTTGDNGDISVFSTITSTGGGTGKGWGYAGATGGSGGGGGGGNTGAGGAGAAGTAGQGNSGAAGITLGYVGGGGGGKGASSSGINGGDGLQNDYRTGSNVYYAGGGGGGNANQPGTPSGQGGQGGGGDGGHYYPLVDQDGAANTGGGGGGVHTQNNAGDGGSGIVVIRFLSGAFDPATDMTLVSNSTTAETTPTKGDIVMTYTNGAGTATLNTDLTAEFSADNGSTWTSTTLVAQGSTGTHLIVSAHDVTRTSTSGTSMVYRIKTLNQGASKETRIQAVSLGWS